MGRWLDIALLAFVVAVIALAVLTGVLLARYCISSAFSTAMCQVMTYTPHSRP